MIHRRDAEIAEKMGMRMTLNRPDVARARRAPRPCCVVLHALRSVLGSKSARAQRSLRPQPKDPRQVRQDAKSAKKKFRIVADADRGNLLGVRRKKTLALQRLFDMSQPIAALLAELRRCDIASFILLLILCVLCVSAVDTEFPGLPA
jgi:hypothetical protein